MKLAFNNLLHHRGRFGITIAGVAFAILLMVFQGSLLFGFLGASSKLVDAADADIWITARGVECFDFSATLPRRFVEIARGVPGVAGAARLVIGSASYRTAEGKHHVVMVVGGEPEVGGRFPLPYLSGSLGALEPDALLVDASNVQTLGVARGAEIEINRRRGRVTQTITGFSSFLGSPYVFSGYTDATRYLGLGVEESMYILLRVTPGAPVAQVKKALERRLPEVDVWTTDEFAARSRQYWLTQTGAGGGILMAALLGFVIGLVVVSQSIYATTMENIEEYATLRALGATRLFLARVVLAQAFVSAVIGAGIGVLIAIPAVEIAKSVIPWIATPSWLPLSMFIPSLLMCFLAAMVSIRAALNAEPARVFRA